MTKISTGMQFSGEGEMHKLLREDALLTPRIMQGKTKQVDEEIDLFKPQLKLLLPEFANCVYPVILIVIE